MTTNKLQKINNFVVFQIDEGKVNIDVFSAEKARIRAESEYEKFQVIQDKNYVSDFGSEVNRFLQNPTDNNNRIKVVIFDLDGLLINSQPLQYKAYNQVFSKHGFPISKKEWEDEWIHNSISCKKWVQKNNLPLDFAKIRSEKKEVYEQLILTDLKLKDGANNVINTLSNEYQICIASASMKSSIDIIADKFDFSSRFEKIISDQESHIKQPKPYPDVFLHVAEIMGVLPTECLVIEDSVAGLKAAKAANMKCIICPDSFCEVKISEFKSADRIVKSLNEIDVKLVNQLNENK